RPDQVEVLIHPQSTVHAMIEFQDGSVIAQLGVTDMKMPIQYALYYPERKPCPQSRKLDWKIVRQWDFEPPDREKFPALGLAYRALESGGSAGCTLNAADEVAVEAFLNGQISFPSIADVLAVDRASRQRAAQLVAEIQAQAIPAGAGARGWKGSGDDGTLVPRNG